MPDETEDLPAGGVFISHCHEDNDFVRELAKYLVARGHLVYVDIESLRGGDTLGRAIARFINASSKVVLVLSKVAIGKRWVLTEIEWTLNREINEGLSLLVPYCLDREALDWFRKDIRLGCRLAVLGFGRPEDAALPELARALPPPRPARGTRSVEARLSRDDELALSVVDLVVESHFLCEDGKADKALLAAARAADQAREAGFDTELSRALEAQKSILISAGRIKEAQSLSSLPPSEAALVLEVLSGGTVGKLLPLEEGRSYVLGRSSECDLRLLGGGVSGKHCLVRVRDGTVTAKDLESKNGTFVDGRRIDKADLGLESILGVGDAEVRLTRSVEDKDEDAGISGAYRRVHVSGVPENGACAICKKPQKRLSFQKHEALFDSKGEYCIECFLESDLAHNVVAGGFRVFKPLGAGVAGEVYEAVQIVNVRSVAFKILKTIEDPTPDVLERFFREAQVEGKLEHTNIVQFIDAGQIGPKCYVAMELVEGESLARILASRRKIPVKESLRIGYYVAKALAHAAERGVVHRDVRPANILVRYDGVVKLGDFGLVRQIEEAGIVLPTNRGRELGRVLYSPPEAMGDDPRWDLRSDIYSLGGTLYESLAGEKPFPATNIDEAIRQIRTRTPEPLHEIDPGIPEALSSIVARAMAKRPEERYASPADLKDELGKCYMEQKRGQP